MRRRIVPSSGISFVVYWWDFCRLTKNSGASSVFRWSTWLRQHLRVSLFVPLRYEKNTMIKLDHETRIICSRSKVRTYRVCDAKKRLCRAICMSSFSRWRNLQSKNKHRQDYGSGCQLKYGQKTSARTSSKELRSRQWVVTYQVLAWGMALL